MSFWHRAVADGGVCFSCLKTLVWLSVALVIKISAFPMFYKTLCGMTPASLLWASVSSLLVYNVE
jgi:hypothetical protein